SVVSPRLANVVLQRRARVVAGTTADMRFAPLKPSLHGSPHRAPTSAPYPSNTISATLLLGLARGRRGEERVGAEAQRAFLKAILFAALAQYSLRVSQHEPETLEFMQACFALIRARCTEYGGELVATAGDGFVVLCEGASSAVEFAMAIQQAVDELQGDRPDKARFRVGLHLGEI